MKLLKFKLDNFLTYFDSNEITLDNNKLILVGANGSGKSNIFRFFSILRSLGHEKRLNWKEKPYWNRKYDTINCCRFEISEEDRRLIYESFLFLLLSFDDLTSNEYEIIELGDFLESIFNYDTFMRFLDIYLINSQSNPDELEPWYVYNFREEGIIFFSAFYPNQFYIKQKNDNEEIFQLLNGRKDNFKAVTFNTINSLKQNPPLKLEENSNKSAKVIIEKLFETYSNITIHLRNLALTELMKLTHYRNRVIILSDLLEKIKFFPTDSFLTIAGILKRLTERRISILPEDRGILNSMSLNRINLRTVQRILFQMKMNSDATQRESFESIKKLFNELIGIEFDIILERIPVQKIHDPILMLTPKQMDYWEREDLYSIDLKTGVEKLTAYEPNVVFHQNNVTFTLNEAPGGAYEILMVLTTLLQNDKTTIFLDEPGKTLHPVLLKKLRDQLTPKDNQAIIFITHSPELIHNKDLSVVVRCSKDNENITHLINLQQLIETDNRLESFCHNPRVKSFFFSEKVLFIEGSKDELFFTALFELLFDEGYDFVADLVSLGGKGEVRKAVAVAQRFLINWILINDFDAWIPNENRKIEESELGRLVKELKLSTNSLDWLKSTKVKDDKIKSIIHEKERKFGIFTWENEDGDLEGMIKQIDPSFNKNKWKNINYEEIRNIVFDLLEKKNSDLIKLIDFFKEKNYLKER